MVENEEGFLLHLRKYTDSRVLVDFITSHHGRVSGVLRRGKQKQGAGLIQPFSPLLLSWRGRTGLKTLDKVEMLGKAHSLQAKLLYCGLYINEILLRLLPEEDPNEQVFSLYRDTLELLARQKTDDLHTIEPMLRFFELALLDALGFGVDLFTDMHHREIGGAGSSHYRFIDGEGFLPVAKGDPTSYPAEVLVNIRQMRIDDADTRRFAKRLCRQLLKPLLGPRPLKARELFR